MADTGDYLILFGDLVGSTEVATEVSPTFFARTYIASFHWAVNKSLKYVKAENVFQRVRFKRTIEDDDIRIAGDEVLSFTPLKRVKNKQQRRDLVASVIAFAYLTKLYWLASPYNLQRMLARQFPRDIAVGIHIGPAATLPVRYNDIVGLHINVAKRIENRARVGKASRIFASQDVTDLFAEWCDEYSTLLDKHRPPLSFTKFARQSDPISVKGIPKNLWLLELDFKCVVDPERGFEEMQALLEHLSQSPETEDADVQKAAKIMAETFLAAGGYPFREDSQSGAEILVKYTLPRRANTAEGYIDCWFKALNSLPKIFWDESWHILNCYFVSCSFMRHCDAKSQRKSVYINKGREIYDLLSHSLRGIH